MRFVCISYISIEAMKIAFNRRRTSVKGSESVPTTDWPIASHHIRL